MEFRGIFQQTHLFKIANHRWLRAMGSVEKSIKRPKCVAQKLLKKVNRTQGSSGVNQCDLVYGASAYPFPLVLLYFRRWFTIGATVHLCFPLIFFPFTCSATYRARQQCNDASRDVISNTPEFPELTIVFVSFQISNILLSNIKQ